MTDPFRVPKHQIAAEVCLSGESPMQMKLFLSECAENHEGTERPSDLLNGPAKFLPAAGGDGKMTFVNRDLLTAVRVQVEDEFSGDVLMAMALSSEEARSSQIDVVMEDGSQFQGTLSYLMPEGQRRLQDFLNHSDRFLVVREGETVVLLNKNRIVHITAD